jgi:hypothetical protein
MEGQDVTRENKPMRAENGQLLPGNTANPYGRPKGSLSITAEIKKKLEEYPEGDKKTYLEQLIQKIMDKAVKEGDTTTQGKIWAYIDGLPKENLELSGEVIVNIVKYGKDSDNNSPA